MKDELESVSDAQRKRNGIVYISRYLCQASSNRLASGAFASAFMLYIGLTTENISVVNFGSNLGLLLGSVLVLLAYNWDKTGLNIIRIGSFGSTCITISMLISSFLYRRSLSGVFLFLVIVNLVGTTIASMRNSAEINSAPMLFGRGNYAGIMAKCGYIGGTVTLTISLVTIFILKSDGGIAYYRIFYIVSAILMTMYALLGFLLRRPKDQKDIETGHVNFRLAFTKKYLLASLPHLTRGLGAAAFALWPAAIMARLDMTPLQSSLIIPVGIAAEIIGSFCYMKISDRVKPGTVTMIGFVVSGLCMFATPVITTIPLFFVGYFVYEYMRIGFGKALTPTLVYSCSKEELSLMSSLHVLYYAIAYCPAVLLFGKYLDRFEFPCMLVGGAVYICSGILWHFFYYKKAEE